MQRPKLDIVCFTGNSGLSDYAQSLHLELSKQFSSRLVINKNFAADGTPNVAKVFGRTRRYPLSLPLFLFMELFSWRPEILVFQSWLKFPLLESLVVRMLRLRGGKLVLTVHDTLPHYPKPWSRLSVRSYFSAFDGLVTHSQVSADAVRKLGYKGKITVIPHGSYSLFNKGRLGRDEARAKLGIAEGVFAVLFFGHVDERKGCVEFVHAARDFLPAEAVFIVAGAPDFGVVAAREFRKEALAPSVKAMLGRVPQDEVETLFRAADLVALPYREGSTSGVFKLAVEFGVPVVCTDVGDLGEAARQGAAFGIPAGPDIAANLSRAVRKMMNEPHLREGYAARMAEERARTNWTVVGEQYASFINSI
jgi:glycosyltransferase involved in cell wall biosynthesis